ncbi:aminoglycoside phosphotransferase family protein [Donghicola tyrosinivorans]|uniref:Aminoglycoside phosphotransferase domain-containing protein n=1 Tax=Donghicola tyrosinivorans TaxID=1652492 RepID=A0A2T0WY24_9RHOB|nr:phosphotransferase [Donghicola tyrosinivorans]PRY91589.1 hypothetical protein CLV74_103174 [Donghicola tyrosinivorans]
MMDTATLLKLAGWDKADATPLAGDASSRRYTRLTRGEDRAILMQAPKGEAGGTPSFARLARHLRGIGLSAPKILSGNPQAGLLLLEDFGDGVFARQMAEDPAQIMPLYRLATDVLVHLHERPAPEGLPVYNARMMADQAMLLFDWPLPDRPTLDASARDALHAALIRAALPFDRQKRVLMLRDYHAENLMLLTERQGIARAGLLDFQDACLAHPAYDLVSLLQDARRDVDDTVAEEMTFHYLSRTDRDSHDFYSAYAVFGTGRALRILGIFARLAARDGKDRYLAFVPRVLDHLRTNLGHPAMTEVAAILSPLTGEDA